MEQVLDVSELEPCEPLEQALKAVETLKRGDYLRLIHRREPRLLYPMLEKAGFDWLCREGDAGGYEILIWHHGDTSVESEVTRGTSD